MIRRLTFQSRNQHENSFGVDTSNSMFLIRRAVFLLLSLLFGFFFSPNSANAQCDISYANGNGNINLALNEYGLATINSTLFENYVSSSSPLCHPDGGGQINLYTDANKTTVFTPTTYNCSDVDMIVDATVYVALENINGEESSTVEFNVTVVDQYPPSIECPANVLTNLSSNNCTKNITSLAPVTSDNCVWTNYSYDIVGQTTRTGSGDADGTFNAGLSTVTYTVTDAHNNVSTCSFTVTLNFTAPQFITGCGMDQTVSVDDNCEALVTYNTPTAINGCAVTFTADAANIANNSLQGPGIYPISFNFTNGTDDITCAFNITVKDAEAPSITTNDQSMTTTGCVANYIYDAVSDIEDNCSSIADMTISYTLVGGSMNETGTGTQVVQMNLSVGLYNITFTATDASGNIGTHTYELNVIENIAPTAIAQDVTIYLDEDGGASVTAIQVDGGSTDNCTMPLTDFEITYDDGLEDWNPSLTYDCADLGTNNILFRVTDGNGNVSMIESAVVTVVDGFLPVAQCEDFDVDLSNNTVTVLAQDIDAGSYDNCNSITNYEITVDTDNDGTYDVAYTSMYDVSCPINSDGYVNVKMRVTDSAGAQTECFAKIIINDTTAPTVMAMDYAATLDVNGTVTVNAMSFDNGSTEDCVPLTADSFTFSITGATGVFTATKDFDCDGTGTYSNVYLKVTNSSGLESIEGPVTLIINDNILPTANCLASLTVDYDAGGDIYISATDINDGSTDNCSIEYYQISDGTAPYADSYTSTCTVPSSLTLQVTDSAGLTATCSTNIIVEDNIPPTAVCHISLGVALISNTAVIFNSQIDAGSMDACGGGIASTEIAFLGSTDYDNYLTFDCSHVGTQQVVLKVTDNAGLFSTCIATVEVQENQAPIFTALPTSPQTIACSDYDTDMDYDFDDDVEANDNCATVTITHEDFGYLNGNNTGTITRTYTATDANGNSVSTSIDIIVSDNVAPTFTAPADYVGMCSDASGSGYTVDIAGEPIDEADNCDAEAIDGGANEATAETYHGYFNFINHSSISTAYNFAHSEWNGYAVASSETAITIESPNAGITGLNNYTITAPASGWIAFDYSYSTADTDPLDDSYGYIVGASNFELTMANGRILFEVLAGQQIGFYATTLTGTDGAGSLEISNFTFVDENVTPESIDCSTHFEVARIWTMTDAANNDAAPQLQRIVIKDTEGPEFNFNDNFTVSSSATTCNIFVDLDMSVEGRLTDSCGVVSITNDALANYGKGNATDDASGYYAPGDYTVTFQAQDNCNTATEYTINFTVEDNTSPTLVCHDQLQVTIGSAGSAEIDADDVIISVIDNCGVDASLSTVTPNTFTTADYGSNAVLVSVTDYSGMTSSCTATVNVVNAVEYDAAEVAGVAGSIINVPITTRYFSNINGFEMNIELSDPSVAQITGINGLHSSLAANGTMLPFSIAAPTNQVSVSYFSNNTAGFELNEEVLFNIEVQFSATATEGDMTNIVLSGAISTRDDVNGNPQSVPTTTINGLAEVLAADGTHTVSGAITTIANNYDMENVTVNLTGSVSNTMVTGIDGTYSFEVPAGGSAMITPMKDTDWRNSGNVNVLDVVKLHRLSLELDTYSNEWQKVAGDMDNSGSINILDVVKLHRISLGLITSIPENTSWRFTPSDEALPTDPHINGFTENREYFNVIADEVNQDFYGIKVGDLVAPFASGSGFTGDNVEERDDNELMFTVDNFTLEAGQEYAVQIKVNDFASIAAYQYTLKFDETAIQLNDVVPADIANLTGENFNTNRSEEGLIATNWYDLTPLALDDETVIYTLNFTALQSGVELSEILRVVSEDMPSFYADEAHDLGNVKLEFQTTTATANTPVYDFGAIKNKPNPFADHTLVSFTLPQNEAVTLTIIDVTGKAVFYTQVEGKKGYNEVKVDAANLPRAGVFHYRIDSESGTATAKMVVLK